MMQHLSSTKALEKLVQCSRTSFHKEVSMYCSNSLEELATLLIDEIKESRKISYDQTLQWKKALIIVPSKEKRSWLTLFFSKQQISLLDVDIILVQEFLQDLQGVFKKISWQTLLMPTFFKGSSEKEDKISLFRQSAIFEYSACEFLFRRKSDEKRGEFSTRWQEIESITPEIDWTISEEYLKRFHKKYQAMYFFGSSTLSQKVLDLFSDLLLDKNIYGALFIFSPCFHFWSDTKTTHEVHRILGHVKKKGGKTESDFFQASEILLTSRNELLSSLGIVLREFAKEVEESVFSLYPQYVAPYWAKELIEYKDLIVDEYLSTFNQRVLEKNRGSPTLLQYLQADMLLFVQKRDVKREILEQDSSIQLTIASTVFHEVDAFYKFYRDKVVGHDSIPPGHALVLVPSIEEYHDAFSRVFHKEQPLRCQFWDFPEITAMEAEKELFVHWMKQLFEFLGMNSSFSIRDTAFFLRSLSFHPLTLEVLFRDCKEKKEELISQFLQYLEKIKLDWYLSPKHMIREMVARGVHLQYELSLHDFSSLKKNELLHILNGSFHETTDSEQSFFSHRESLNAFIELAVWYEHLDTIFVPPIGEEATCSIEEWIRRLRNSLDLFFGFINALSLEESEAFEIICQQYMQLHEKFLGVSVPFSWFAESFLRDLAYEIYQKKPKRIEGQIIVAQRGMFDTIPAEVIAVLGANQDRFPEMTKKEAIRKLEILSPMIPNTPEVIDKALFLDSLLFAKSHCYMSALREASAHEKDFFSSFSPLVKELIRYIDTNYIAQNGQSIISQCVYEAENEVQYLEKSIHSYAQGAKIEQKRKNNFSIHQVLKLQDPLSNYIESTFKIHPAALYKLDQHDQMHDVVLKPSLRSERRVMMQKSHKKNNFLPKNWPKGYLGDLCLDYVDQKISELYEGLGTPENIDVFLFNHEFQSVGPNLFRSYPAIELTVSNSRYYITGRCIQSCTRAFVLFSDSWKDEIKERFVEYLIRAVLYFRDEIGSLDIFWKGEIHKTPLIETEEEALALLAAWVLFQEKSQKRLYPYTHGAIQILLSIELPLSHEEKVSVIEKLILTYKNEKMRSLALEHLEPLITYEFIENSLEEWCQSVQVLYQKLYKWASIDQFQFQGQ